MGNKHEQRQNRQVRRKKKGEDVTKEIGYVYPLNVVMNYKQPGNALF